MVTAKGAEKMVLGLDPGYADLGFGVIRVSGSRQEMIDYGSIKTSKTKMHGQRLEEIYDVLQELIVKYKPNVIGFEKLFFSKNVKTALLVAEARGVIQVVLAKSGAKCVEVSPQQVKLAVCGHGGAEKTQVQKMVKTLLGLREIPKPDDAADALAIALAVMNVR